MPRRSAASLAVLPVAGTPARLSPPASLGEAACRVFVDIVTACSATQFTAADLPLLVRYCECAVLAEQAMAALQRDGAVGAGEVSPWISIYMQSVKAMSALAMRLRISPQARAPNNPTRPQRVSVYERMRLEQRDDDDAP